MNKRRVFTWFFALLAAVFCGTLAFVGMRYVQHKNMQKPLATAKEYMRALQKGDAGRAISLTKRFSGESSLEHLAQLYPLIADSNVYSRVEDRPSSAKISCNEKSSLRAVCYVSYTQADTDFSSDIFLERNPNPGPRWVITEGLEGTLSLPPGTVGDWENIDINGASLSSEKDWRPILALPGTYKVASPPATEFLTFNPESVQYVEVRAGEEISVGFAPIATQAAKDEAIRQAREIVNSCLVQKRDYCPKQISPSSGLLGNEENLKWEEEPTYETDFTGNMGTISVQGGRINADYKSNVPEILGGKDSVKSKVALAQPWKLWVNVMAHDVEIQTN